MEIHYVDPKTAVSYYRFRMRGFLALSTPVVACKSFWRSITDMRHELVEFSRLKQTEFPKKLRHVANTHHDMISPNLTPQQTTDGILRYSNLRFAIAEDRSPIGHSDSAQKKKRKNKNLGVRPFFFARTSDALATQVNIHGHNIFINDEQRYYGGFLPANTPRRPTRDAIEECVAKIENFSTNDMTVWGGNLSALSVTKDRIGRLRNQNLYGYSNDKICITVRQNHTNDGGGWTLKLHKPFHDPNSIEQFTPFDNINPQMIMMKAILSNGTPDNTYRTKEEALAYMDVMFNASLQRIYQHKAASNFKVSPNKAVLQFVTFTTSAMQSFANRELNFENFKETVFDAGWALGSMIAARWILKSVAATSAPVSIPVILGSVIAYNYAVRKFKGGIFDIMDKTKLYIGGARAFFGKGGDYVHPTLDNMKRKINAKPNLAVNEHLHVLNGRELKLNYRDTKQTSPVEQEKIRRRRMGYAVSMLSKKAQPIDRYTSTTVIFNGVSCLSHYDPKKGVQTAYFKLTGPMNLNKHIQISNKEKEALEGGKIVKHVYRDGGKLISESVVPFSKMKREISCRWFKIHDEKRDIPATEKRIKQAEDHINWLFNNQADKAQRNDLTAQQIEEKNTPATEDDIENSIRAKRHFEIFKLALGDEAIEINPPTREHIRFYKGCALPDMGWIAQMPS